MKRTTEQEQYVSEILGSRKVPKRGRPRKEYIPVKTSKTDYMRNCIFGIDEYIAGRNSLERLHSALNSLQVHLNDIRKELITDPTLTKL